MSVLPALSSVTAPSRIAWAFQSILGHPLLRALAVLLGCAAAMVPGRSSALNAQEVRFRAQAGLYLPTRISIQSGLLHIRQKVGVRVGGNLTLAFNERFDVTTRVTYIPGYAMVHGAGKQFEIGTASHSLSATTGARYWLLPRARELSWEVYTGLGVVFGGQPSYDDLFGSSTVSGIVGTVLRYQIGQIVRLQLRIQDRLYRAYFGARSPGRSRPPLQVSFGLGFPFLESLR